MPAFVVRVLTPLFFLSTALGCNALWNPFSYDAPNNCVPSSAVCGPGFECNYQREVCEASVPLPTLTHPSWRQPTTLLASDGTVNHRMGQSVSLSGETALVGSYGVTVGGMANAGAAYVFGRDPQTELWTQQAKLVASDPGASDFLGAAVSLFQDTALLGAESATVSGAIDQGAAYVFVRSPGLSSWTQQAKLVAADGVTLDSFASSVALFRDGAILGARRADPAGLAEAGAAYFFVRNPQLGTWAQPQARLVASDGAAGDQFGSAASLSGDTALIGAPLANLSGKTDAGAAYVFVRNPGNGMWEQRAKLVASDGAASDEFGNALALEGDTAVIAAHKATQNGKTDAGAAYVFVRDPGGGNWTQQAKLVAQSGMDSDLFGTSVALSGDRVAIGASGASSGGQLRAGLVYLYSRAPGGTTWTLEATLAAADPTPNNSLGDGVALSPNTLLAGAPGKPDAAGGADVGAAYVFHVKNANGDPCTSGRECTSTFCVDGVCCDTACGGSALTDCQACSAAAGATSSMPDGTCRPRRPGQLCRASTAAIDPPESCDGQLLTCPPDRRE